MFLWRVVVSSLLIVRAVGSTQTCTSSGQQPTEETETSGTAAPGTYFHLKKGLMHQSERFFFFSQHCSLQLKELTVQVSGSCSLRLLGFYKNMVGGSDYGMTLVVKSDLMVSRTVRPTVTTFDLHRLQLDKCYCQNSGASPALAFSLFSESTHCNVEAARLEYPNVPYVFTFNTLPQKCQPTVPDTTPHGHTYLPWMKLKFFAINPCPGLTSVCANGCTSRNETCGPGSHSHSCKRVTACTGSDGTSLLPNITTTPLCTTSMTQVTSQPATQSPSNPSTTTALTTMVTTASLTAMTPNAESTTQFSATWASTTVKPTYASDDVTPPSYHHFITGTSDDSMSTSVTGKDTSSPLPPRSHQSSGITIATRSGSSVAAAAFTTTPGRDGVTSSSDGLVSQRTVTAIAQGLFAASVCIFLIFVALYVYLRHRWKKTISSRLATPADQNNEGYENVVLDERQVGGRRVDAVKDSGNATQEFHDEHGQHESLDATVHSPRDQSERLPLTQNSTAMYQNMACETAVTDAPAPSYPAGSHVASTSKSRVPATADIYIGLQPTYRPDSFYQSLTNRSTLEVQRTSHDTSGCAPATSTGMPANSTQDPNKQYMSLSETRAPSSEYERPRCVANDLN